MKTQLDAFTRAYLTTALWSSTEHPSAPCPCCGETRLLSHLPEADYEQEPMCSGPECGVTPNENPPPMGSNYSIDDLSPAALAQCIADCERFQRENADTLAAAIAAGVKLGQGIQHAGHDFWLTRNGHGCGFWDSDWPDIYADKLTEAATAFGECNLYAGDDGKLYL